MLDPKRRQATARMPEKGSTLLEDKRTILTRTGCNLSSLSTDKLNVTISNDGKDAAVVKAGGVEEGDALLQLFLSAKSDDGYVVAGDMTIRDVSRSVFSLVLQFCVCGCVCVCVCVDLYELLRYNIFQFDYCCRFLTLCLLVCLYNVPYTRNLTQFASITRTAA